MVQDQRLLISPAMVQTFELLMLPSSELLEVLKAKETENPLMRIEPPKRSRISNRRSFQSGNFDSQAMLENTAAEDTNLYHFLMEQVHLGDFDERSVRIAEVILSSVDDNGLLAVAPEKLIEGTDFRPEEFEAMRLRIQRLEPVGIASRTFQEYLEVQTEERFGPKSLEYRIIHECADLLEKKLYSRIAKKLGVDYIVIEEAIAGISRLNLQPGANFTRAVTHYVVPDANVTVIEGKVEVHLNDDYVPEVRINDRYLHEVTERMKEEKLKSFMHRKVSEYFNADPLQDLKLRTAMIRALCDFLMEKKNELVVFDEGSSNRIQEALKREFAEVVKNEVREFLDSGIYLAILSPRGLKKPKSAEEQNSGDDDGDFDMPAPALEERRRIAEAALRTLDPERKERLGAMLRGFLVEELPDFAKKDEKDYVDRATREFLAQKKAEVATLMENLKSRREIIRRVITTIVEKQKDFFLKGPAFQVPLKLKDIAEELSIHESTVSRVVKDKYIQTDRGIISLKHFFSTNVGAADVSSSSIKDALKKIVENEDKNAPLSDGRIVRILANKGMVLSRRTVAKYRDELNIPAAYIRRNPV